MLTVISSVLFSFVVGMYYLSLTGKAHYTADGGEYIRSLDLIRTVIVAGVTTVIAYAFFTYAF